MPLFAGALLWFGASDLGPAWTARSGGGTTGTFTAQWTKCHGVSGMRCTFYGVWVAGDGGSARNDVVLYDPPQEFRIGDQVEATDTGAGDGVFATSGSFTFFKALGLTIAGMIAAVYWLVLVAKAWWIRVRRRRNGG